MNKGVVYLDLDVDSEYTAKAAAVGDNTIHNQVNSNQKQVTNPIRNNSFTGTLTMELCALTNI